MKNLDSALNNILCALSEDRNPEEKDLKIVYDTVEEQNNVLLPDFYKQSLFETLKEKLETYANNFDPASAARNNIDKWTAVFNAFKRKERKEEIYSKCWNKGYGQYLKKASEELDKMAKENLIGTSGSRKDKSFKDMPEEYKIQSGLNALAVLLENDQNICVAVGYKNSDPTSTLYVGANVDPTVGYDTRLGEIKAILLAVKNCTKVGEKFAKKIKDPNSVTETFTELIKNSSANTQVKIFQIYATKKVSAIEKESEKKANLFGTICYIPAIKNMINGGIIPTIKIATGNNIQGTIHAEIKVISNIEHDTKDLFGLYLGISKVCCAKCAGYFYSLIKEETQKYGNIIPRLAGNCLENVVSFLGDRCIFRDSHCGVADWNLPSGIKHLIRAVGNENVHIKTEKKLRDIIKNSREKTNKPTSAERGMSVESTRSSKGRITLEVK